MPEHDFIAYVGPSILHDSIIESAEPQDDAIRVCLRSAEGMLFEIVFDHARFIDREQPENMVVYSLTELRSTSSLRRFVFSNSDEKGKQSLAVEAQSFSVAKL